MIEPPLDHVSQMLLERKHNLEIHLNPIDWDSNSDSGEEGYNDDDDECESSETDSEDDWISEDDYEGEMDEE